ncbi:hypothetical protein N0V88_007528 [Collariella sp. IMI 366227]|nr:hypothetical protein N0V88_007528 [Collariella sp. IMI 366227]
MSSNENKDVPPNPTPPAGLVQGKGRVYAYETPALAPGAYNIDVTQTVSAPGQPDQQLTSSRPFRVKATDPYTLPPGLVHSFYPPRMRSVSATTLPHIMLTGAVPWERPLADVTRAEGSAPYPWLALLVFLPEELSVPLSMTESKTKPSATKALSTTLDAVNSKKSSLCLRTPFPKDQASTDTAAFIFVKGKAFRSYFERQRGDTSTEQEPALSRYRYLTYITDTGEVSSGDDTDANPVVAGQQTNKYSTILGHRSRPYSANSTVPQTVHAHLVSLEGLASRVDWEATEKPGAVVAMVSLFSWTYTWDPNDAEKSMQLFEGLVKHIGPLAVALPKKPEDAEVGGARDWMRGRLEEGYTIVRHRDLAGETSMALYRGPLCPKQPRRIQIKPSMYGTDMQIIDMSAKILDVSYSVAWDLGRSLAGRDGKFSATLAALRRQLVLKAMAGARTGCESAAAGVVDFVGDALRSLNDLFSGPLDEKMQGCPETGKRRWQRSAGSIGAPGVMTQAKLRRNLISCSRPWVLNAVHQLCNTPVKPKSPESEGSGQPPKVGKTEVVPCDIPILPDVIRWILENLLSLKLVPALYLFPDPTVLGDEVIQTFLVDDTWVDAMVDGALSVGNTVGGIDDPVRDEIRGAINEYMIKSPGGVVRIPSAGFVMRSALIESFPDTEITATRNKDSSGGGGEDIPVVYRRRHDDTLICMCARGPSQTLNDFSVSMKLPAHQQRSVLQSVTNEDLTMTIRLQPLVDPVAQPAPQLTSETEAIKWRKNGAPMVTPTDMGLPVAAWNWESGIMIPHAVAYAAVKMGEAKLGAAFKQLGSDSGSVYLATQLTDRQHSLVVPFKVKATTNSRARQLFPLLEAVTTATSPTLPAQLYDPAVAERELGATHPSLLTKKAFSLLFPDKNIPVQPSPAQTLVFVVQPGTEIPTPAAGVAIKLESIDITLPVGYSGNDLLDEDAADPRARVTDRRKQWMAAAYRKSATELGVRLRPRVPGKALPLTGLNASFMLTGVTVNGVLGDRVRIRFEETYIEERSAVRRGRERVVSEKYTVSGSWFLAKE